MVCHNCKLEAKKHGKDRKGLQRYRCNPCNRTFQEHQERPFGNMYLRMEQAVLVLRLLTEGCSIRSTERLTDINRNTILDLIVLIGERCERFLENEIQNVSVKDVQCDEIWAYVQMKEKTKKRAGKDDSKLGDAYTFTAIERHSKLVLAWHLGRRSEADTIAFTEKLARSTADHNFQVTTDGFKPYQNAVVMSMGTKRIDFAQLIKVYAQAQNDEQRYSPAEVIETVSVPVYGTPDPEGCSFQKSVVR